MVTHAENKQHQRAMQSHRFIDNELPVNVRLPMEARSGANCFAVTIKEKGEV